MNKCRGLRFGALYIYWIIMSQINKKITIISLISVLLIVSCSNGPGSTSMTEYRRTIGTTTLHDFEILSEKILNQHRYFVDRIEEFGSGRYIDAKLVYIPKPSDKELIEGIEEVRYRLKLEARVKGGGVGGLYTVRAIVNSYGRYKGSDDWVNIVVNDDIKKSVRIFIADLKSELENKIRVF